MGGVRHDLQIGTQIETEQGNTYQITGNPIGCGGSSIIYPARKLIQQNGLICFEELPYAVKECFPYSMDHPFTRDSEGEIVPRNNCPEDYRYLYRAQQFQLAEGLVSQKIFRTASRMVPIREISQCITLTVPGSTPVSIANVVTIMDSLSEKGRSLGSWLREKGRFSPATAFRIIQQLLFSLKEVHQAGYLHLDIQDGNVFLRGALEEKSEFVSLIDFGCARPMQDGKTAPIENRVIFTTRGYSAPEILLKNDGSLQLGPEADIYSVGCLTLYLLTGQIPDTNTLLSNRSGIYLPPNQIRRIKCPRHLVDRLQQLLAKALAKEPENRYHSAEEMLLAVTDLVDALQPYRCDLSSVDYDAFICYRHGDIDSNAAKYLQKRLENFRAPRGISQKKYPFRRVFVDEGELSSCADFGEQIHAALKNSGWLVVVCSPSTPLSPWVQSEIDTFLRYHDRSRILAILTGREPEESFPSALLGQPDGSGEILAADARGATWTEIRKKLSGDALLRLAAPMLGTTFDSLKQRRKIQLFQQIAAASVAALTLAIFFSVYAVRQNHRIQEEYRKNLISESKYLAALAQTALDDGDALKAMDIALRALPSEELDRPVIPQAQFVLEQSIGAYALGAGNLIGPATAKADYHHDKLPTENDYYWDASRHLLLSCDNSQIYIADTNQHIQTGHIDLEYDYSVVFRSDLVMEELGHLFYGCRDHLFRYDYVNQNELWQHALDEGDTLCSIQYLPKHQQLAVITSDLFYEHVQVQLLDAATGNVLKKHAVPLDGKVESIYDPELDVSPDETMLAFEICFYTPEELTQGSNLTLQSSVVILNLESGATQYLHPNAGWIGSLIFSPDSQLLVSILDGASSSDGFYASFRESAMTLLMVDPVSGKDVWMIREHYAGFADRTRILFDTNDQHLALVSYGNHCMVLNRDTGTIIQNHSLSGSVLNATPIQDDFFLAYTADGYQHLCTLDSPDWFAVQIFPENLIHIIGSNGNFFAISRDNPHTIRQFALWQEDRNWKQLVQNSASSMRSYTKIYYEDEIIALYGMYGEPLTLVDTATGAIQETVLDCASQNCSIQIEDTLGVQNINGQNLLLFSCSDSCSDPSHDRCGSILSVDIHTMEQKIIRLPRPKELLLQREYDVQQGVGLIATEKCSQKERILEIDAVHYSGDTAYFSCMTTFCQEDGSDQDAIFWYSWKIGGNDSPRKIAEYAIPKCSLSPSNLTHRFGGVIPNSTGTYGLLIVEEYQDGESIPTKILLADLRTGSYREIVAEITLSDSLRYGYTSACSIWWNKEGTLFALVSEQTANIYDVKGNKQSVIDLSDSLREIRSIYFVPNSSHILVWSDTSLLSMYDMETGKLIAQEKIPYFITPIPDKLEWHCINDHMLILDFGHWLAVMDPTKETWGVCSVIPNGIGYDEEKDCFYTRSESSDGNFPLGFFARYSTEQLVTMGNS